MTTLTDIEIQQLIESAHKVSTDNASLRELAADLRAENDMLRLEGPPQKLDLGVWQTAGAIITLVLVGFVLGWIVIAPAQWDAGYRVARAEADECPK